MGEVVAGAQGATVHKRLSGTDLGRSVEGVQLVPGLDDSPGGVSDLAHVVGGRIEGLSTVHAADWRAVQSGLEPFAGAPLLLHYVGYGFAARGAPYRVVRLISRRKFRDGSRLVALFHELWSFGPPWRSSFWTHLPQRFLAQQLLASADAAVTSLPRYRDALERLAPGKAVDVLPIPSTVGEPPLVAPYGERQPQLVVFGSAGWRDRAYRRELTGLVCAADGLKVREILDIGGCSVAPPEVGGIPVRALGRLPRERVSQLLLGARAGFLAYPPDYLGKSSIFAAYLAHGLVPICSWSGRRGRPPHDGEVWIRSGAAGLEERGDLEVTAHRARASYWERSIARHAELWQKRLFPR